MQIIKLLLSLLPQPCKKVTLNRVEAPRCGRANAPWSTRNRDALRGCPNCSASPRVSSTLLANPANLLRGYAPDTPSRINATQPWHHGGKLRTLVTHGNAYSWPTHTVHSKRAESWRHNRRVNNWDLGLDTHVTRHTHQIPRGFLIGKIKISSPLPEEGHTFSCNPKSLKAMRKTRLSL